MPVTILARRPRLGHALPSEYVLIDRGETRTPRYVSAIVPAGSEARTLGDAGWAHGRYFADRAVAMAHFETREG